MTKRSRAAQLEREIEEVLSRTRRGRRGGHSTRLRDTKRLTINHRRIPPEDLRIAMFNASRDPDGQVFPWRPMQPLAGGTVYHAGKLWTVVDKTRDGLVQLAGQGHGDEATVHREDLRPITWTQHDEDQLQR